MLRFLGILLAIIFLVPLIRSVLGTLARLFTMFAFGGGAAKQGGVQQPRVPAGGVLRKDPVCGTYVSEAVAQKLVARGETHYFCGDECRKKFQQQV